MNTIAGTGKSLSQPLTFYEHNCYSRPTDIHEKSQTSYTNQCNGIVNHGAQIGGLWVFADHTCKNKRKTNAQ